MGTFYYKEIWWKSCVFGIAMQWIIDHSEFTENQIYIGGGSYAGIFIPVLAQKIYDGNIFTWQELNIWVCVCMFMYISGSSSSP